MNGIINNNGFVSYEQFFSKVKYAAEILRETVYDVIVVTESDLHEYFLCALAGVMAGKKVVLLHPQATPQSASKIARVPFVQVTCKSSEESKWKNCVTLDVDTLRSDAENAEAEFRSASNGTLIFRTSGTTSDYEKYAEVPFSWMLTKSKMLSDLIGIESDDVGLIFSYPCFIQVFWTFLIHTNADSSVVFAEFGSSLAEIANKYGVTTLVTTAAVMKGMLCSRKWEFRHLKKLVSGGDYMDVHTLYQLGTQYPDAFYTCVYGCTETSAANVCSKPIMLKDLDEEHFGIGLPSESNRIEIVYKNGERIGEICIKTPYASGEYYLDKVSYLDGNGYFHTGDLGYVKDNGIIVFAGRKKSVINYNGQKILAIEVENAISEFEDVTEAVVMGEGHSIYGEIAVCYLVVTPRFSEKELCEFLKTRVEWYKIPKRFVCLPALPKTVSGKIIRRLDVYKEMEKNL